MPPLVLYVHTRPAFLLARARTFANNTHEWWGKLAIPLNADVTGGDPRIDYRWANFKMLTKLEGVVYSGVPTLPQRDYE